MPQVQKRGQGVETGDGKAGTYREFAESLSAALEQLEELKDALSDPADTSIVTPTQWANLQGKLMALTGLVREINAARLAAKPGA